MGADYLHVCLLCGRDTSSESEVCRQCAGGKSLYRSEHYGRSGRYMRDVDDDEPDEETSETRYHGDNWEG